MSYFLVNLKKKKPSITKPFNVRNKPTSLTRYNGHYAYR